MTSLLLLQKHPIKEQKHYINNPANWIKINQEIQENPESKELFFRIINSEHWNERDRKDIEFLLATMQQPVIATAVEITTEDHEPIITTAVGTSPQSSIRAKLSTLKEIYRRINRDNNSNHKNVFLDQFDTEGKNDSDEVLISTLMKQKDIFKLLWEQNNSTGLEAFLELIATDSVTGDELITYFDHAFSLKHFSSSELQPFLNKFLDILEKKEFIDPHQIHKIINWKKDQKILVSYSTWKRFVNFMMDKDFILYMDENTNLANILNLFQFQTLKDFNYLKTVKSPYLEILLKNVITQALLESSLKDKKTRIQIFDVILECLDKLPAKKQMQVTHYLRDLEPHRWKSIKDVLDASPKTKLNYYLIALNRKGAEYEENAKSDPSNKEFWEKNAACIKTLHGKLNDIKDNYFTKINDDPQVSQNDAQKQFIGDWNKTIKDSIADTPLLKDPDYVNILMNIINIVTSLFINIIPLAANNLNNLYERRSLKLFAHTERVVRKHELNNLHNLFELPENIDLTQNPMSSTISDNDLDKGSLMPSAPPSTLKPH